jgi:prolyl oligopeptidase
MPFTGSLIAMLTDPRVAGTTFGLTGWTHTLLYYRSDATLAVAKTDLKPPSPFDASGYTSQEAFAPSADGTAIPLSLIYRKGLKLDGSHPTYLEGYGAYGYVIDPDFETARFAWLERSGVYAVCHVRGGGWYGEGWHRAGMLATKQHTIDDFIACGRWLVAHHYTTPRRLAGEGTSAGGIPIGGAIVQAPQLFAAALDVVGESDVLRSEFTPDGPANIPEFGTQTTAAGFHDLYAVDPYLHVRDGTPYPAVMLITGINDRRVAPWEPAKLAARLQAASSSGRPILLRVDYDAGHGLIGASRAQADALIADEYSFLLWQLGDPAFQAIPQRVPR